MKSAHRHELQTNELASRLDDWIERIRPYLPTVGGAIVAIAVLMLVWSYMSKSSEERHGDAWNAFNQAISTTPPNLDELHRTSEEFPGTQMQEMANITWADGQTFTAAELYLYNHRTAKEALDRATSAYQSVLQSSSDPRLLNRAHLGLARVYEMGNQLDKARDEYGKVTGGYTAYAKMQIERLNKPEAAESYAWLEKAEPPRLTPPVGPGVPGRRPEFNPGDISLPPSENGAAGAGESSASFEDLLKGLRDLPSESGNRYEGDQAPPATNGAPATNGTPESGAAAPAPGAAPAANATPPATNGAAPPTTENKPAGDSAAAPTSGTPTPPAESTPPVDKEAK